MPQEQDLPLDIRANHEAVFCIFLLLLAFFFRNHPAIVYPQLLYVLGAFLAFNFLFNRFLKQTRASQKIAYAAVLVNGILITSATGYSGGASSYLWVMYLLPIFSSCLLFNTRATWAATLYVIALHTTAYWSQFYQAGSSSRLEGLSRVGLLVLSASVTARLAASERDSKLAARRNRQKLEETLRTLFTEGSASKNGIKKATHEINNIMTVIMGSAEILLLDRSQSEVNREDLVRIKAAAGRCLKVLRELHTLTVSEKSHV